ncbi:MAG: CoA-binding protein [Proteobacteria bacterium]|nr:CoA-binding protein [Pseudomonadota bacterium]
MLDVKNALEIIYHHKTVAVVGLSPKTDRPSYRVGGFLIEKGFKVIPVNPTCDNILDQPCIKSLADLEPGSVDWLDLFVNPARLIGLADDVVRLSPKLVWCQIGVVDEGFNQRLLEARIPYIADVCPKIEWGK